MAEREAKQKILIIDDEEDIRVHLNKMLSNRGYYCFSASDGQQGLDLIKEHDIEIIFSDIMMPGLNGIDFLKAVHNYNLAAQVIMVTGKTDLDSCIEAVEYGACGYLIKPVEIDSFIEYILLAQRNINEKKEIVKKVIEQLKPGQAKDMLNNVIKSGGDVQKEIKVIKKTIGEDKNKNG